MTHPEQAAVETASAIVANARRLGLTWERALATVVDPSAPTVMVDADTVAVDAIPMVGPLFADQRVYVDKVPPGANFIVGFVQPEAAGLVDRVDSTASTGAIGAETIVLTSATILWQAGYAYEVLIYHPAITGSLASNIGQRRLRRTNIAGAELSGVPESQNTVVPGSGTTVLDRIVLANRTTADINDVIVATLTAATGTVNSTATATRVRYMEVRYAGPAARYPNAVQI